ncbi:MAG: hypothetical protein DRN14_07350 [Thermoplasmata archaeon]|nr:MAG: hypothetical protein DRN14_07350 [Thermoplasmata archaeon]
MRRVRAGTSRKPPFLHFPVVSRGKARTMGAPGRRARAPPGRRSPAQETARARGMEEMRKTVLGESLGPLPSKSMNALDRSIAREGRRKKLGSTPAQYSLTPSRM